MHFFFSTGTQNITFRFPPTPVPNTETNYMCMTFDLPSDDEYHLVATEAYIDNAQVMHHIVLYGCEDGKHSAYCRASSTTILRPQNEVKPRSQIVNNEVSNH